MGIVSPDRRINVTGLSTERRKAVLAGLTGTGQNRFSSETFP
ncbi:hypothetical protein GCWU000342_01462 [Shuttleworthella satelles DSM 14600]|uniref:Uncharacterized protein n=1 Tax=Shuttleworthella satelles DSM 14600 TaxID=626523 RepID=C4GAB7_9FIRM|nr:hypothetical protein GCWU000342_01462 [Shuttleworthia satelles DSM 14600]